jgi:hypothetical protein
MSGSAGERGCGFKLPHGLYIGGGEVGIDRVKSRTDFAGDGFRCPRRAHNNVSAIGLGDRLIDLRGGRFFQAGMAHVADDSNDGAPLHVMIVNVDTTPDGVAIGEIFVREAPIHDGKLARMSRVAVAEKAASNERNAHCGKISGSDPSRLD